MKNGHQQLVLGHPLRNLFLLALPQLFIVGEIAFAVAVLLHQGDPKLAGQFLISALVDGGTQGDRYAATNILMTSIGISAFAATMYVAYAFTNVPRSTPAESVYAEWARKLIWTVLYALGLATLPLILFCGFNPETWWASVSVIAAYLLTVLFTNVARRDHSSLKRQLKRSKKHLRRYKKELGHLRATFCIDQDLSHDEFHRLSVSVRRRRYSLVVAIAALSGMIYTLAVFRGLPFGLSAIVIACGTLAAGCGALGALFMRASTASLRIAEGSPRKIHWGLNTGATAFSLAFVLFTFFPLGIFFGWKVLAGPLLAALIIVVYLWHGWGWLDNHALAVSLHRRIDTEKRTKNRLKKQLKAHAEKSNEITVLLSEIRDRLPSSPETSLPADPKPADSANVDDEVVEKTSTTG